MEEIEHIGRELGMRKKTFISRYVRAASEKGTYILQNKENTCPFFPGTRKPAKEPATSIPSDHRLVAIGLPACHALNVAKDLKE